MNWSIPRRVAVIIPLSVTIVSMIICLTHQITLFRKAYPQSMCQLRSMRGTRWRSVRSVPLAIARRRSHCAEMTVSDVTFVSR